MDLFEKIRDNRGPLGQNADKFDGYFVTPYYPGQKKVLDLGVRWYFFN